LTSPHPVRNATLMSLLAQMTARKPLIPRVPGFLFRLALGEFAVVFTEGQRVLPAVLQENGFQFTYTRLEEALFDLLEMKGRGI